MSSRRLITLEPLTPAAFAPFGTVIQNPSTAASSASTTISPTIANQGSATKYPDISALDNFYHLAPSKKASRCQVSLFICKPRELRKPPDPNASGILGLFDIDILERHPYTTQTFIPLGLSPRNTSTCFLVIVAPTLATTSRRRTLSRPPAYPVPERSNQTKRKAKQADVYARARPRPFTNDRTPPVPPVVQPTAGPWSTSHASAKTAARREARKQATRLPRGSGPPSMAGVRAFLARGDQAVAYAPGTWHAPMVVLGAPVEFVVVQWGNGVGVEDCQEVQLVAEKASVSVVVDGEGVGAGSGVAELRSKL